LLHERSQRVKIGGSFSNPLCVTSGVPQGSVLGPILFIFYINDITEAVKYPTVPKLYADDLKAYCPVTKKCDEITFKDSLTNISNWAND
jgi:hypothetical protein